jgi:hypothetical protein
VASVRAVDEEPRAAVVTIRRHRARPGDALLTTLELNFGPILLPDPESVETFTQLLVAVVVVSAL